MNIKLYITIILLFALGYSSHSQTKLAYRQPANVKAIPKLVVDIFNKQYPGAMVSGWFVTHITYWQNDISSGWYSDWYGQRQVVVYTFEKPAYFEVEFSTEPGELSRAIYNIYGYWYETRTQISGLPRLLQENLNTSEYGGWKISRLKEMLESPAWPGKVYRFQVSKGLKARIIRMDDLGNIIQAKYLED
ncbi:MAG: hypothetical protein K9G76_10615 [Bacteroidales bacterium]|nr:hypothetical protein [Bacteroidales bacterium]MCF8404221.1 hypothetical protein [Bacteroidales bacterium]